MFKIAFYLSRRTVWGNVLISEIILFWWRFRTLIGKTLVIGRTFLEGLSKLISTWTEVHFEKKTFWKKLKLFIIFGSWAKIFQLFVEKSLDVTNKTAFCLTKKKLKKSSFFIFFGQWLNSTCSQERFQEKTSVLKNNKSSLLSFSDNERTLLAALQTFWTWLPELLWTCLWEHFQENCFVEQNKTCFPNQFWTLSESFWILWRILSSFRTTFFPRRLTELDSLCSVRYLEGKFLLENFFSVFGHSAKSFRASIENF